MRSDGNSRAARRALAAPASHAGHTAEAGLRVRFRIPNSTFRNGFTLIELMVVIAIIAILAGLLMPAIRSALNKAHEARVQNMIHQCQIAATSYFNDHGDYPPSTWQDLFLTNPFKTLSGGTDVLDLNGDGVVDITDYNLFIAGAPAAFGPNNQGIRIFLACVATRNGGPYLQPSEWQLMDTGLALPLIQADTNWYFNSQHLFELVDWWANPLVYIHNRDYTYTDGVTAGSNPELYIAPNGENLEAFSRSSYGFRSGTPPNLDSYQLFSTGLNGYQSTNLTPFGGAYWMPYTAAIAGGPGASANPWTLKQMDFLANWEE